MILLAINWSNAWMQVFYLILSLSILVVLHEFGHYITAKWFGCRVEKFYLFFNPWFSLVKKKVGETEYGIGWLPLGGYVKISGMIDESMDKEAMKQPPKEYEFRSKPAWQRLIIMLGGIIVNVLLAFIIYAMVLFIWGETKVHNASVKDGIWVQDSVLLKAGFKSGDKITAVDGKPIVYFDDIQAKLLLSKKPKKVQPLVLWGLACVVIGYGLDWAGITPIIKRIATSSFTIVSLGWCLWFLAFSYWWIDIKGHRNYLKFFTVVGMNSIFIYVFFEIVGGRWFNGYVSAISNGVMDWFHANEMPKFIIAAFCIFILEWLLCYFLYRKKIFFRL